MMAQGIPDEVRKLLEMVGKAAQGTVDIVRSGDQIILPDGMDYREACEWLQRKAKEEETKVAVDEIVEAFPLDGAVCFAKALQQKYGWVGLVPTPGFWGSKDPPQMIGVEVGPGKMIQVPWGRCQIPNVSGWVETSWGMKDNRPIFRLVAEVMRKDEKVIHELADLVRSIARTDSIYRGKAIRMNFRKNDGERIEKFNPAFCPHFIDTSKVNTDSLILPQETMDLVQTTLFNPVEFSDRCRKRGIPLKRGVLLEGPFGTGKTLTAYVLASKCVNNDWTFLYLQDVRDLDLALQFAQLYEPCAVFAEDVDMAVKGDKRNADVNRIFNIVDGVDSKQHEIMVVLTTNKIEVINRGFIRPGRIDAVLTILPPDTDATIRLIRQYGGNLISATDDELTKVVEPLVGFNAAVIREAVERAKLASVDHEEGGITARDIGFAAISMRKHLDLLTPKTRAKKDGWNALGVELSNRIHGDLVASGKVSVPKSRRSRNGDGE